MVSVANTIVDERTVVIKTFNASVTCHAVNSSRWPDCSAEETEVIKISALFDGSV